MSQDTAEGSVGGSSDTVADTGIDAGVDSSTDTLPEPACKVDADCDDGDPCTTDVCHNQPAGIYCMNVRRPAAFPEMEIATMATTARRISATRVSVAMGSNRMGRTAASACPRAGRRWAFAPKGRARPSRAAPRSTATTVIRVRRTSRTRMAARAFRSTAARRAIGTKTAASPTCVR